MERIMLERTWVDMMRHDRVDKIKARKTVFMIIAIV